LLLVRNKADHHVHDFPEHNLNHRENMTADFEQCIRKEDPLQKIFNVSFGFRNGCSCVFFFCDQPDKAREVCFSYVSDASQMGKSSAALQKVITKRCSLPVKSVPGF
jgi:hypothetical protein